MTVHPLPKSLVFFPRPQSTAFWTCNLIGWVVYFFSNVLLLLNQDDWFVFSTVQTFLKITFMFSFCVLFRMLFISQKWQTLPIARYMLVALVYSIVTGMIATWAAMSTSRQLGTYTLDTAIYDAVIANAVWRNYLTEFAWSSVSSLFIMLTWTIGYGLICLFKLNKDTEIENLKLHNALREAEMDSLKAQINPHFLLNTLNNLRSMIRAQHPESVNIVTAISEVLKYSLTNHHKEKVTLEEELEIVQNVIDIAKLQLGERLAFSLSVEGPIGQALIPPFAIQLLVENAIKHGIEKRKEGGNIKVKIFIENDELHLVVTNSGLLIRTAPSATKVGLANLKKRLHILYLSRAKFSLEQENDTVVACVQQPLELI